MIGTVSWSRVTVKTTGLSGGETLELRWSRREDRIELSGYNEGWRRH